MIARYIVNRRPENEDDDFIEVDCCDKEIESVNDLIKVLTEFDEKHPGARFDDNGEGLGLEQTNDDKTYYTLLILNREVEY